MGVVISDEIRPLGPRELKPFMEGPEPAMAVVVIQIIHIQNDLRAPESLPPKGWDHGGVGFNRHGRVGPDEKRFEKVIGFGEDHVEPKGKAGNGFDEMDLMAS